MQIKNRWNQFQKRIPYHIVQKALFQLSVAVFCCCLFYYGLNLIQKTKTIVEYDFAEVAVENMDSSEDESWSDSEEETGNQININTASKEMLMTLPNIGEKKAEEIIRYREEQEFFSIEDIMEVSGIGEKTFENLKALITV